MEQAATPQGYEPSVPPAAPDGGPAPQQAAPEAPPPAPSKPAPPVNVQALQAGLTRATQQNAAAKKALGLPASATEQQLLEAIAAMRTPQAAAPDLDDPQYDARWTEMREREYATAARVHSPEAVATVRQIEELALAQGSPIDLTDAVVELARQLAATMANGAPAPQQAAPQQGSPAQPPVPPRLPVEGDRPVPYEVQLEPDERDSGNVEEAARSLFARLGGRR